MTRRSRLWRLLALLGLVSLLAAACGDDDDGGDEGAQEEDTTESTEEGGGGETLAGMRGTLPLVELSEGFRDRLLEQDPDLGSTFNYAGESYDSVVITALAAEIAGSDGIEHASEINGVTRGGEKCEDFASCKELIDAGTTDIDFDGISGPLEFSGNGEPTEASYGVQEFGDDNRIDESLTEFRTATAPPEADVEEVPVTGTRAGDGVLKIGTLLPETGSLAFLGPPMIAGVQLAVNEINEAGGVLGQPVQIVTGDSGDTSTNIATQSVNRELGEGVDVVVGAASSSVTLTVIDQITAAGVTMFSPANTSKALSTYEDEGLYFRTAPSDILQGQVLGEVIVDDGASTVAILNLDDDYGNGLAEDLQSALEEAGAEVVLSQAYDPQATEFNAEVQDVVAQDPDAVVVIGFEESSRVLTTMVEQGVGPGDKAVYGTDGNMGDPLGESFEAGE